MVCFKYGVVVFLCTLLMVPLHAAQPEDAPIYLCGDLYQRAVYFDENGNAIEGHEHQGIVDSYDLVTNSAHLSVASLSSAYVYGVYRGALRYYQINALHEYMDPTTMRHTVRLKLLEEPFFRAEWASRGNVIMIRGGRIINGEQWVTSLSSSQTS